MTKTDALTTTLLSVLVCCGLLALLFYGEPQATWKQIWQDALTAKPDALNPDVVYARAEGLYRVNDMALAEDATRRTLILEPGSIKGHKLMTAIFLKQDKPEKALPSCQEAARLDPSDMTTQITLGSILGRLGRKAEAEVILKTVLHHPAATSVHKEEAQSQLMVLGVSSEEEVLFPAGAETE